jgi:CheY-like chemotaxis protein
MSGVVSAIDRTERETGFTVVEAANAHDAIAVIVSQAAVDLVFTDINMPGEMDGEGLANWLSAQMLKSIFGNS